MPWRAQSDHETAGVALQLRVIYFAVKNYFDLRGSFLRYRLNGGPAVISEVQLIHLELSGKRVWKSGGDACLPVSA